MRGEGQCAKASGGPQSGERIAPLTCVVVRRGSKLVGIGRRNPKIPFRRSAEQVPASQKEPRAAVEASGIFDETISAYGQGPPTSKQLKHAPVQQTVRALDVQWGGAPKGGETGERQRGEPLSFVNVKEEVRVPLDNATGGHEGQGGMQHKNKGGHGGGSLAPVGKGPAHAGTRGGASSTLGGQRKKRWPRKPEKGSQKPAPKCSPRNVALAAAMAPGSGGKRCDACGVAGSKRWYDKSRGLCMCIQCNKKEQCRRGKEGGAGDAEQQTVARDGREATAEAGLGGKELQPVLAGKGKKRKRGRVAEAPCKKKNRAAAQRFPLGSIRLGKHLLSRRVAIWWPLDKK